jgi:macrolide-specific efflux system membrane fusion protein
LFEVTAVPHEWPERPEIPGRVADSAADPAARRRSSRPVWAVLGGIVLVAIVALVAVNSRATDPEQLYQTSLIGRHDVEETVAAAGRVRPRAHGDVGARVSGQLRKLHVKIGDLVQEGQLLAEIDAEAQEAKVEGIRAELARLTAELAELEASLVFAERQHARQTELSRSSAASRAREDEARRDMDVAKARRDATIAKIRQTKASLRAEQVALNYTRIVAPMSGTVVSIEAVEGQTLNANYEAPEILRIADLEVMTVWTEVSESDVARLSVGMPLSFTTLGHPDRSWKGTLREVLPAPQRPPRRSANADGASTRSNIISYVALFDVQNGDGALRAEMTAHVLFVYARSANVIAIPTVAFQALDSAPDNTRRAGTPRDQVYVLNADGKISARDVVKGVRGARFIEAKSGISVGERVIIGEARRQPPSRFRIER